MKRDLAGLMDRLDAGILITDKQGRVLFANSIFRKLSGSSAGSGLGKTRIQELQTFLERIATPLPSGGLDQFREKERAHILSALNQTNGKIYGPDGAAVLLGLPPTTLVSRLRKYGIPPKRTRKPAAVVPEPAFAEPEPEPPMLD
jgi:PAS domain-containing protein